MHRRIMRIVAAAGAALSAVGISVASVSCGGTTTTTTTPQPSHPSAAPGARLWASRYNGPGNGDDFAASVVVNRAGTVFVTGASKGAGSGFDYATVAYRG